MVIRVAPSICYSALTTSGIACGWLTGLLIEPLDFAVGWKATSIILLASLLLLTASVPWLAHGRRGAVVAGAAFGYTAGFVALERSIFDVPELPVLAVLIVLSLVVAAATGAVALAVFAALRASLITFIEDDGNHCLHCGYYLAPSRSLVCSECGTATSDYASRRRDRNNRIAWINRWAPLCLTVATGILLGPAIYDSVSSASPLAHFRQRMEELGGTYMYGVMLNATPGQDPRSWSAIGSEFPVKDRPSKRIVVSYAPYARGNQPVMQIRLNWHVQIGSGISMTFDGLPSVVCNLSREQAKMVLAHGIPLSLVDALEEAASSRANWSPSPPVPGPGGVITQSTRGPAPPIVVSADSHF